MSKKLFHKNAYSTTEYIALFIFLLSLIFVFQNYIVRGFSGRWKNVGDIFGFGRQYDPRPFGADGTGGGTQECMWIESLNNEDFQLWVATRCFRANCDCTLPPDHAQYNSRCRDCIRTTCRATSTQFPECRD